MNISLSKEELDTVKTAVRDKIVYLSKMARREEQAGHKTAMTEYCLEEEKYERVLDKLNGEDFEW